jgi:hypothetical protein
MDRTFLGLAALAVAVGLSASCSSKSNSDSSQSGDAGASDATASSSSGGSGSGSGSGSSGSSSSGGSGGTDAGASEDGGGGVFTTTSTAATGSVYGTVIDGNGNLVAGVTVTAGTGTATTDTGGNFALDGLPTGRFTLTASVSGYFTTTMDSDVSAQGWRETVVIVPEGTPTTVTSSGATVTASCASSTGCPEVGSTASSATIAFPAGAYSANTSVYAAWLSGASLAASPGSLIFGDSNSPSNLVLGVLDVNLPAEPAQPATVTVPVPSGLTASDLALYDFDSTTGDWGTSVAPTSVSAGYATFAVSQFSAQALVQLNAPDCVLPTTVSGPGAVYSYTFDGGSAIGAVTPGSCIPMGATISAGDPVTVCHVFLQCGNTGSGNNCAGGANHISFTRVCLQSGSLTYTRVSTGQLQAQAGSGATKGQAQDGVASSTSSSPDGGVPYRFFIRTKTAVMGVRGTSFSFESDPCAVAPGDEADDVEVDEGEVDVTDSAGTFDVTAGQETTDAPASCANDAGSAGAEDGGTCGASPCSNGEVCVLQGTQGGCGNNCRPPGQFCCGTGYCGEGPAESECLTDGTHWSCDQPGSVLCPGATVGNGLQTNAGFSPTCAPGFQCTTCNIGGTCPGGCVATCCQ